MDEGPLSWEEWLALEIGDPEWLIPGILEKGGGGMVHGASQSYKSFFMLRLCLDLASGQPIMDIWPGRDPLRTFLLQAEGSVAAWKRRMEALRAHYPASLPFWSHHTMNTKLDSVEGRRMMRKVIALLEPDLIVIDPLANFFEGGENDEIASKRWIDSLNEWKGLGPAVTVVHHDRQTVRYGSPQGPTIVDGGMEEARGRTNLPAWADFVGRFRRKGDVTTLTIEKVREEEKGQKFEFSLEAGRLVLTARSDLVEEIIKELLVHQGEWWMAPLAKAASEKAEVNDRTARRAIDRLVESGKLTRRGSGSRFKITRGGE